VRGGREGQREREGGNMHVKQAKRSWKCTAKAQIKNGWEHARDCLFGDTLECVVYWPLHRSGYASQRPVTVCLVTHWHQ
jgi:hypothetical protein